MSDQGWDRRALEILWGIAGPEATFRDGQLEAIEALVVRRERALVVQRTGWGKSAVYLIATRMLRDQGAGPTLLISPLLVLMRNQVEMAQRGGVRAATLNSANRDAWDEVEEQVQAGTIDLLLISPERLNNPQFRREVMPHLARSVGLLVVDEAHCISDWGHDFRPDYRRVARMLELLPAGVPVLCTTATANDRVVDDITDQLGHDLTVIRGGLDRESLVLDVVPLPNPAGRLAWLAEVIPTLPGAGIVYCLTVRDTDTVARWLRAQGIDALAYSGQTEDEDRLEVESALAENRVKVVVATSALGMGYDKPDVAFVVHFQSPGSPIAYYQQVGRAGRALARSEGILLTGAEDVDIQDWFIATAFPSEQDANAVIAVLAAADGPLPVSALLGHVNARQGRVESMLKVLEVEGAVERAGSRWSRTAEPWTYDAARVAQVTATRRAEQAAMADYVDTDGCLMEHLRRQLDDPNAAPCGRCARCTGETRAFVPDVAAVAAAQDFLRRQPLVIEPRKKWMAPRSGAIPPEERLEEGRALARLGDGGWGTVVRQARLDGTPLPVELINAAVELIRSWPRAADPLGVTWVPSTHELGPTAARQIAEGLGLPAVELVRRVRPGEPQAAMENTSHQLANVYGAFEVFDVVPDQPLLLIDDLVDSRWTLTVVGAELRRAGAGPVFPFVLADRA